MKLSIIATILVSLILCSCNSSQNKTMSVNTSTTSSTDSAGTMSAPAVRTSFFDRSGMDSSVKPGDNFYEYANGAWVKNTAIPDDQSAWGGFYTLYEENLKKLHDILINAAKSGAAAGSIEQKTGDYYSAGMDTDAIEKKGAAPLAEMLAKIDAVKDYKDLVNLIAENNANGWGDLMGFGVAPDDKNSGRYIPIFSQDGITLPEKGYYTRPDSSSVAARRGLAAYADTLFSLAGLDSTHAGSTLLALETKLAAANRTPDETRDPQKNYHKVSLASLQKTEPNINWQNYFAKMNAQPDSVNVQQPEYFVALNKLLVSAPIAAWKTKLKFDYISSNASLLTKAFRDARFNYSHIFSGQKTQSARWKTIVQANDNGLGELLGQLYVQKYFTDKAKHRMDELVNNLQTAFAARIAKVDWMSDSTKQIATAKLNAFLKKIGYPSKWKTYDDVTIDRNNYFADAQSVRRHAKRETINKIGKDVDRSDWDMTPPTVNAYYNPSNNEIVFPAGILQFPFFDENADDAINYGGIGMVIGHEMTHGFDDQGSQYDLTGNMQNWWNKTDLTQFKTKTAGIAKQYSGYSLLGSKINGSLTLGENLADNGGIAIAYDAFKMTKQGQGNQLIDGFTPDQRFFMGFAQIWRSKQRPELTKMLINVDPHSPPVFRINGPLSNFDPFYAAFNVQPGDSMYVAPANRVHVW